MQINIRNEIRKVFKFLQQKEQGHDEYSNNGYVILGGKKYFIGHMSYNEWYLEPYYKGRTEKDKFKENCLWEDAHTLEIIQIFQDNNLLKLVILCK